MYAFGDQSLGTMQITQSQTVLPLNKPKFLWPQPKID